MDGGGSAAMLRRFVVPQPTGPGVDREATIDLV
jgi:hypothetical protein